ncbi:peroxisome biogenesis factor 10 [Fopius arisanus]|uniref:RING-type E3 ubiquitin transferase n=1 Tax=Fopius arisanus TaxID=64838 RepID=A0A9R1U0N5_9HYME|nr:PREDICTED: peroxisome biogenesis factor 10 [Fopius arisanus]
MTSTPSGKRIRGLRSATQAEILRSHQRDEEFVRGLREKFLDLLHNFGGYRTLLPFIQSDIPLKLLYFGFTSGLGNQTLGEEYTGIIQADLETRKVPSLSARVLAAVLECFGERGLLGLLDKLKKSVDHPDSELKPEAVIFLNCLIDRLKTAIPLMILVHKGLFYIYGRYYSWGRRLAGVDYAKVYGKRPSDGVSWGLRLLGLATLAQCALKMYRGKDRIDEEDSSPKEEEGNKCQLCLETIPTTTTPCGHLFCWNCLGDWLRTRSQCPYCREHVIPSRIVHLMNL